MCLSGFCGVILGGGGAQMGDIIFFHKREAKSSTGYWCINTLL